MGLRRAEASDPATIFLSVGDVEEGSDEVESSACLSSARRTATSRTHQREAPSRGEGEVWRPRGSFGRGGVVRVSELGAPDGDEHGEQDDVEQRQQQQPDDDAEDDVGAQQAATAATLVVH